MRPVSVNSALFALLILGGLGLFTLIDMVDGPGTARQEREARTPRTVSGAADLVVAASEARFYVTKRYALKEQFVALNGRVKQGLFNHSAAQNVSFGQEGFLFLKTDDVVNMTQGQGRMSTSEIARWAAHFGQVRAAFVQEDLPYTLIIGPNKHSIYPDRLPGWLISQDLDQTRTADVVRAARRGFGGNFVDTRKVLAQARRANRDILLYHPTDTHWTEWGAALAVNEALNKVGIRLDLPRFDIVDLPRSGDLARMIGQQKRLSAQAPVLPSGWSCIDSDAKPLSVVTIDPLMPRRFSCGSETGRDEKVVAFIDSFGVSAVPYLAAGFKSVEFIWSDLADPNHAKTLGADLVLQILVERKLSTKTPETILIAAVKTP